MFDPALLHSACVNLLIVAAPVWSGLMVFQVLVMRDSCNWRFDSIDEILGSIKKSLGPELFEPSPGLTAEGMQASLINELKKRTRTAKSHEQLLLALAKIEEIEKSYVHPHRVFLTGFLAIAINFLLLALTGLIERNAASCTAFGMTILGFNAVMGAVYCRQMLRALRCY